MTDHDRPFPAGARRGLRRGDVVERPRPRSGSACAIEHIAPGEATLSMTVTDFMLNGHGLAHGGFIFALADSAFAFACNGYNQRTVGHQAAITYVAPGRLGDRLTAVGRRGELAPGPRRHLRRPCDERAGRAGRRVPRPFAHRQGNPPAGVTGASKNIRRKRRHGQPVLTRPEGLDRIEIASRDEIAALQLERMKWSVRHAYENSAFYRKRFDEHGVHPDDLQTLADLAKFPFTVKQDLRDTYPFGMFAVPREQLVRIHGSSGHHRQADGGRLHQERHRHLGGPDRPLDPRLGRPARRHRARRLRLRPLHRRARGALRRRAAGLHRGADLGRHDRAAGDADPGLPAADHHGDAVLHAVDPRRVPPPGARPARELARGRHLRRRALDQRHARGDREGLRHGRGRYLRPFRDHGAGRRQRVRRDQGRAARLGGPFLPRDHRPGDRGGAAGRRDGRARLHHPHQGGRCR